MLEPAATQDGNPDLVYIGDLLGGNIRVHAAVAILSKGELSGIATPRVPQCGLIFGSPDYRNPINIPLVIPAVATRQ